MAILFCSQRSLSQEVHPTTASAEQSENEKIFQRGNFSWSPEENPELDLPILSDDDDEVSL